MLPFAFEVNNFFPFRETFVSPWSQSYFFNREERLCSPLLSKSTTFFRFVKLSFHRGASRFSSIARSGYAPPCSTSQPLICILAKFAATQCVDPVTREKHFKQTHLSCQHKNHFYTDIPAKPRPEPISWELLTHLQPAPSHLPPDIPHQQPHPSPLSAPLSHDTGQPLPRRREGTPRICPSKPSTRCLLYKEVPTSISSCGEICLTSTVPLLIFRLTTK